MWLITFMQFRLLTAQDGPTFQIKRIESLQQNPDAYLTVLEQEQNRHEADFAQELESNYHPPTFGYYGAFTDDSDHPELAGYCLITSSWLPKQKHIAMMYNLYVSPQFRHQHVASHLMKYITEQLAAHEHVDRLFITCAASNKPALRFYAKHGFRRCGRRPGSIKWQGQVDDELEFMLEIPSAV
jgi:ribosomal protein S18 acetylase RimI-like enzyme